MWWKSVRLDRNTSLNSIDMSIYISIYHLSIYLSSYQSIYHLSIYHLSFIECVIMNKCKWTCMQMSMCTNACWYVCICVYSSWYDRHFLHACARFDAWRGWTGNLVHVCWRSLCANGWVHVWIMYTTLCMSTSVLIQLYPEFFNYKDTPKTSISITLQLIGYKAFVRRDSTSIILVHMPSHGILL